MKRKSKQLPTRERILEAAGKTFAERGIRATSLREITDQARINNAAVNYHFRSKDDLVKAVFERSFKPVNEARLAALDAAEAAAGGAPLTVEQVLRALFEPTLRSWRQNKDFILLAGRLQNEPDAELHGFSISLYEELIRRFLGAAKRALPEVPERDLFFWLHFLFGGVVHTLLSHADIERLSGGQSMLDDPGRFVESLIAFGSAGLRARFPAVAQETTENQSHENSREPVFAGAGD